jgi:hypothetical protein
LANEQHDRRNTHRKSNTRQVDRDVRSRHTSTSRTARLPRRSCG